MMNKYRMLPKISVLMLLVLIAFCGCVPDHNKKTEQLNKILDNFLVRLDHSNCDNCKLDVYYLNPDVHTRAPLSKEDLLEVGSRKTFDGTMLSKHMELLNQLNSNNISLAKSNLPRNIRVMFVFELEGQVALEIAIGFSTNGIYVNEFEVERNDVFYRLMEVFLGEAIATGYRTR